MQTVAHSAGLAGAVVSMIDFAMPWRARRDTWRHCGPYMWRVQAPGDARAAERGFYFGADE